MKLGQNLSFSVKSEGVNPFIYVIKTREYRSSLRKLICKLCVSFTNKNIRKQLKVLAAFLSNQKTGGQLGLLPRSFFSQNHSIKTMRKPISQKNKFTNFV